MRIVIDVSAANDPDAHEWLDRILYRFTPVPTGNRRGGLRVVQPDPSDLVSSPANRMFVDPKHVGQALGALAALDDDALGTLLPTHGFPADCIDRLRKDDRAGFIEARLESLIAGERQFMTERGVKLPTERTAARSPTARPPTTSDLIS